MIKLPESVAKAHGMPGSSGGFTMAAFKATDVPIGSDLQTADQLKQAIRDALEEAAKVCEARQTPVTGSVATLSGAADAIRKLKEDIQ